MVHLIDFCSQTGRGGLVLAAKVGPDGYILATKIAQLIPGPILVGILW